MQTPARTQLSDVTQLLRKVGPQGRVQVAVSLNTAAVGDGTGTSKADVQVEQTAFIGRIAQMTRTPVIADADTGYGGLLNVRHTVRGYEAAGVTGIQIEDQEFPKKCGHTPNRPPISWASS